MPDQGRLARSRKDRLATDLLCDWVFRPVAHPLVLTLVRLRVPPPAVVGAGALTGFAAAVELGRGHYVVAALALQLKTVLDNADGQLARLAGRVTAFGRYLDSESDLLVNAAIFVAIGFRISPWLALAGFVALTAVLGVNFNIERLYRRERGEAASATPAAEGAATAALARLYRAVYAPQDRLVEAYVETRTRGLRPQARRAWHDAATVAVLANFGLSTQLAVLGVCLAFGQPLVYVVVVIGEVATLVPLALRRELRARRAERAPHSVLAVD